MSDYYGTVEDADTFHEARGNVPWTAADETSKEVALLRATEYLDFIYRERFPGTKVGFRAQLREWPRAGAMDYLGYAIMQDIIPPEMLNATYAAALREIVVPGSLTIDVTPGSIIKQVTVPGAVSVTYANPMGAYDMQVVMLEVERIIRPILSGPGASLNNPLVGKTYRV